MTVAGIAGQRKMTELAPRLRLLAEHAPEPAMRRTALAALGQLHDQASLELFQRCAHDANPLIAAAESGAEHALIEVSSDDLLTSKHKAK